MADESVRIVTRGDDAGWSQSANRAMRYACEHGVLRNAGLMAPCPHVAHAAEVLGGVKGLCLGMHATLTSEWSSPRWAPVAGARSVPSLITSDGCFRHTPMQHNELGIELEHLEVEMQAQLDRLRGLGLEIVYLDEHMGFGWLEGVRELLHGFADRHGLIYRPDIEAHSLHFSQGFEHVQTVETHVGVAVDQLRELTAGTYLLLGHPVFDEPEIRGTVDSRGVRSGEQIATQRVGEREQFCHARVLEVWEQRSIVALRYDELEAL